MPCAGLRKAFLSGGEKKVTITIEIRKQSNLSTTFELSNDVECLFEDRRHVAEWCGDSHRHQETSFGC